MVDYCRKLMHDKWLCKYLVMRRAWCHHLLRFSEESLKNR